MSFINWLDAETLLGQAKTAKLLKERYPESELPSNPPVWTR